MSPKRTVRNTPQLLKPHRKKAPLPKFQFNKGLNRYSADAAWRLNPNCCLLVRVVCRRQIKKIRLKFLTNPHSNPCCNLSNVKHLTINLLHQHFAKFSFTIYIWNIFFILDVFVSICALKHERLKNPFRIIIVQSVL